MANFTDALSNLHSTYGNSKKTLLSDSDSGKVIKITDKRTFDVESGYNTILGYAGDINSQIVTFTLPRSHEGHDLSQCSNKELLWKNKSSGAEGTSTLEWTTPSNSDTTFTAKWEVPPAAMTQAGVLEIAITIYDIHNNEIAFSWNTAPYSGFSIGASFSEVGTSLGTSEKLPAKNEILAINAEDRTIVAPAGYDPLIANFGDKGTSKVYFSIDKILHFQDQQQLYLLI